MIERDANVLGKDHDHTLFVYAIVLCVCVFVCDDQCASAVFVHICLRFGVLKIDWRSNLVTVLLQWVQLNCAESFLQLFGLTVTPR